MISQLMCPDDTGWARQRQHATCSPLSYIVNGTENHQRESG